MPSLCVLSFELLKPTVFIAFGLHVIAFGLHVIAFGLHVIAFGLHVIAFGLHVIAFGLDVMPLKATQTPNTLISCNQ
jgi:hypothetical protein